MENSPKVGFFAQCILLMILSLTAIPCYGQWAYTYGGAGLETASTVQQISDGGYIVAGTTSSSGAGETDAWVLKLTKDGSIVWQKAYGGLNYDSIVAIQRTVDGGYIVAGDTLSFGAGGSDIWILKLNSDGSIDWQKTYGGPSSEQTTSVQQTADGGYILAGYTYSFGVGNTDIWVLKLKRDGSVHWQKTYGGADIDIAYSIEQTRDGGYFVTGSTNSFGAGSSDLWVLKLNDNGSIAWQKAYGSTGQDVAYSGRQTSDGTYIVAGVVSIGANDRQLWVLKLEEDGSAAWQKTYGSEMIGWDVSAQQTADGGYIVAGNTVLGPAGDGDLFMLKLSSDGSVASYKMYTGWYNRVHSIQQTKDLGYVIAGDAPESNAWILKLDSNGHIPFCPAEMTLTVSVSDTAIIPLDTTVMDVNTGITAGTSNASVTVTSATPSVVCPKPRCRLKAVPIIKHNGSGQITSDDGLISCPGDCKEEYYQWTSITMTAVPDPLSTFLQWKPDSLNCSGTDSCTVTIDKKKTVKAVFDGPRQLTTVITSKKKGLGSVTSEPPGISCPNDCKEPYQKDAPVTLTATAHIGSTFTSWVNCPSPSGNVCSLAMDTAKKVEAIFTGD